MATPYNRVKKSPRLPAIFVSTMDSLDTQDNMQYSIPVGSLRSFVDFRARCNPFFALDKWTKISLRIFSSWTIYPRESLENVRDSFCAE